ncbi:putative membrane protein [Chitinophaga niastensis]|uniref:Putative membrane protein n=1 Tax=Chitinophaga niastensis TaxID=536980 RepID=A0A2P8HJI2_CHINA|nr:anthrone oxygenase family protein [Chitinophaga niastensis]PSL46371.1 putative membrane protein [Chitinophaga niastensis]
MTLQKIILLIAATTTGLVAGVFYTWSCSVTTGLARMPDEAYIATIQTFNKAILNPVFFISFLGTLVMLPLATYLNYTSFHSPRFLLLLAATIVYLIGGFGVTAFGNVPLNDMMEAFNLHAASAAEMAAQRIRFEQPWNTLNNVRTITSILSMMLVTLACLSDER